MIGTITLNPSIDYHWVVECLTKDDTNRASFAHGYPGGKGVNVSKVVRELGGSTTAYALVGGFSGDFWEDKVKELDIRFQTLRVKDATRINAIITDHKDRTQTRISSPGPCANEMQLKSFLNKLLAVRPKPFAWALGGSLSSGMKTSTYRTFVRALQKNGTPCILDADNEALRSGLQSQPFMIKPNEHELERLTNKSFKTIGDYQKAATALVRKGITLVVVSLGARGAVFATKNESFYIPSIKVPIKSKVGAGDSLIGGLLWGLSKKMSLEKAAALGVAASTSAVMREAPRLCLKSDIPALLKRVVIRRY